MSVLSDILEKRGSPAVGHNSASVLIKLNPTASSVEVLKFEPDPITYRSEYYYNSTDNILYKRVISNKSPARGIIAAYWKRASYD